MSTAVFIVFLFALGIYAGVNLLSRSKKHTGRDPVNPFWSLSQWNPDGVRVQSTCSGPSFPGDCVIEGLQQVFSASATRTCAAPVCIDFDGSNVKGNSIPFRATCNVPYCSWSQCLITFDGDSRAFLVVDAVSGVITATTVEADATRFFMQRQTVNNSDKRIPDQNGTLAQFFIIPTALNKATQVLALGYMNTASIPDPPGPSGLGNVTKLMISQKDSPIAGFLDIFVLLEALPQKIAGNSGLTNVVPKKILAFGGDFRRANPESAVLKQFTTTVQSTMWKAINANQPMTVISWQYGGFYGLQSDEYVKILNQWSAKTALVQDALEIRLKSEDLQKVFYVWI